ncbi:2-hydroxyacid dehydrogenase [Terrimonas rubra]|uniref:2-hydroxyacid dehydrogenase n=1 Tax=Terrimonas rubra TaxID=1035890 RepID=A0ABW6ABX0_9BACT
MKVYITRMIPEAGLHVLRQAGVEVIQYTGKTNIEKEELVQNCQQADALLSVGPNKLDAAFLQACSHLKGIALMSAGYDQVDIQVATDNNIPVSNTPDVLSNATADVAFLLMLAVSRNAFYMHKTIGKKEWSFFEPTANLGIELYGKTLGILGLGRIGMSLAQKCTAAYNMQLIYHNRNRNTNAERTFGARYVSFEQLLQQSDVLSVHANLTPATKNMFNKAAFDQMKPTAIFINTARGALHNEQDLTEALKNQTIWGAGLDVTNPEPMLPDNPLLQMRNVCVLPHIGSATQETRSKMAVVAANNIVAALQGKPMPQVLNNTVYQKIQA